MEYIDETRMIITYLLPLAEIVYNFFDKLKSYSKGYASFDYEMHDYQASKLVKMDILLNGSPIDALSSIVFKDFAYQRGLVIVKKLKVNNKSELTIQCEELNKKLLEKLIDKK